MIRIERLLSFSTRLYRCAAAVLLTALLSTTASAAPYDGLTPETAALSAKHILTSYPAAASGLYYLDPDGPWPGTAVQVFCDQGNAGGGWTLVVASLQASQAANGINISINQGPPSLTAGHTRNALNLAENRDAEIRYVMLEDDPANPGMKILVFNGVYTGRFSELTPAFITSTDTYFLNGTVDRNFNYHAGNSYDVFVYVRELVTPTPIIYPPIPTLGTFGILMLASVLTLFGLLQLRERQTAKSQLSPDA